MLDTNTFLTLLYAMSDDFCKTRPRPQPTPGAQPSLSQAEVLTLCIFSQWRNFASERDFYRFAGRHLRPYFPDLPHLSQFNRLQRACYPELVAFWQYLTQQLRPHDTTGYYEALDATAVATRHVSRRGSGWLVGQANKGRASRLGWYTGFYLLAAADAAGVFTGWAVGCASCKDQPLASAFLQARAYPHARLPSVGPMPPKGSFYLTDSGFQGQDLHLHWLYDLHAEVITPPQRLGGPGQQPWKLPWRELRHWIASLRQIVESAFGKLHHVFRLRDERPHSLEGFLTRLAAKITLHNFCIYLNRQLGRPNLAFADLWSW
jgi:hypothetical protein